MNNRIRITLCLSLAFTIIAVLYVCGCSSVSTGPENNNSTQKDCDLTLEQKQVEWQKMKKWRSVHGGWIDDISVGDSKKQMEMGEPVQSRFVRTFTLSERQLALLDWYGLNSGGTRVKGKRMLPGRGVEFDVYFPGNNPGGCSLDFVSSGEGGSGSLVGTDIRGYGAIALKFTLVSINGKSGPELKQKLVAGVVIGPTDAGRLSTYEPVTLGLADSEKTVIAKTYVSTDKIYEVGFHVHMLNPENWEVSGSMITLRVESAGNSGDVSN